MRGGTGGISSPAEALVESGRHGRQERQPRHPGQCPRSDPGVPDHAAGRVSPGQAGLPVYRGDLRRVPGLGREEAALIAGISSEYYTRLERGNATGFSDSVIAASRTHYSSMTPSARICSSWSVPLPGPVRHATGRPRSECGPRCSASRTR
jgi:hypothetical protein